MLGARLVSGNSQSESRQHGLVRHRGPRDYSLRSRNFACSSMSS
jgi:hypothetical protein